MNNIGKHIRSIRSYKHMTQEELAEKLFVTRQTVSNYETGKSQPDIETLLSIATALDTDINALIYGVPLTKDQKHANKWLMFSGILLLVLGTLYFLLDHWIDGINILDRNIYMQVFWHIFRPPLFFILGWFLFHVAGTLCKATPISFKYLLYIRITIYVLTAVLFLIPLPFILWLCEVIHQSIISNSISMRFPAIPIYSQLLTAISKMIYHYPYGFSLLGGICWLFGIPHLLKKRKNAHT